MAITPGSHCLRFPGSFQHVLLHTVTNAIQAEIVKGTVLPPIVEPLPPDAAQLQTPIESYSFLWCDACVHTGRI